MSEHNPRIHVSPSHIWPNKDHLFSRDTSANGLAASLNGETPLCAAGERLVLSQAVTRHDQRAVCRGRGFVLFPYVEDAIAFDGEIHQQLTEDIAQTRIPMHAVQAVVLLKTKLR
jgi:hypothetical protein